jgi:hypothetical protein
MDITQITSLLSAASVPSNAVTAVADLFLETEKIAEPFITQKLLHANDDTLSNDIQQATEILSMDPADPDRAQRLEQFSDDQLRNIGTPIPGGMAGPTITIRVDRLLAYFTAAAQRRRDIQILNDLVTTASKSSSAKPAAGTTGA